MTDTMASVNLKVNGQDYIFSIKADDGTLIEMTNLVTQTSLGVGGQGIGDTFPNGAVIQAHGPTMLNSTVTGASTSVLGAYLVDPNNNIVAQFPMCDSSKQPVPGYKPCNYPVGLNYQLKVLTAN
jgi:hypothetical protein